MEALALATTSGSWQFTAIGIGGIGGIGVTGVTGVIGISVVEVGVFTSGVVARLTFSLLPDLEASFISPPKTRPTRPRDTVLCMLIVS
jgi:hypothetical protein